MPNISRIILKPNKSHTNRIIQIAALVCIIKSFIDSSITTRIFKIDVSDHFPDFLVNEKSQTDSSNNFLIRRDLSSKNIEGFKKIIKRG